MLNRRTLLKATAGVSTLALAGGQSFLWSAAQSPMYEATLIFEYTEFLGTSGYEQINDGFANGVSLDGTIAGSVVSGGKTIPATWDLSGAMTPLDTGDIEFGAAWNISISPSGKIAGNLSEGADLQSGFIPLTWANGTPELLPSSAPTDSASVFTINDSGVAVGAAAQVAARWVDGQLEQLPLESGATSSGVVAVTANGDAYGRTYAEGALAGAPWRWALDGTVEELPLPEEVTANAALIVTGARYPAIFEDGSYVLVLNLSEGDRTYSGVWTYDGSTFTALPSSGTETYASAYAASSLDEVYGSVLGAGPATGSALWKNGTLILMNDVTVLPPAIEVGTLVGFTAAGEIVARTSTLEGITPGILVLRPI